MGVGQVGCTSPDVASFAQLKAQMDADARINGDGRADAPARDAIYREQYLPIAQQLAAEGDPDAQGMVAFFDAVKGYSIDQLRDLDRFFGGIAGDPHGDAVAATNWIQRLQADATSGSDTAQHSQQELDDFGAFVSGAGAAAPAVDPAPAPPAGQWQWPVHAPVSQEFGGDDGHPGIDIAAAEGTPIHAATSGTVVIAGDGGTAEEGYGNVVVIQSDDGRTFTRYAHQSEVHVQAGQHVNAGDEIGLVGHTGEATGPHLHFEVRTGDPYGEKHNPREYAAGDP